MKPHSINSQNKAYKTVFFVLFTLSMIIDTDSFAQSKEMMVRMAELEILPADLERYRTILKEEAAASVKLEPGVIVIFPMYQKENPTQVKILEIYADRQSYESHLKTPHFQHYKTSTLNMIKSLKLTEMTAIDPETMSRLFLKLN